MELNAHKRNNEKKRLFLKKTSAFLGLFDAAGRELLMEEEVLQGFGTIIALKASNIAVLI